MREYSFLVTEGGFKHRIKSYKACFKSDAEKQLLDEYKRKGILLNYVCISLGRD